MKNVEELMATKRSVVDRLLDGLARMAVAFVGGALLVALVGAGGALVLKAMENPVLAVVLVLAVGFFFGFAAGRHARASSDPAAARHDGP
jgi:tetrahydromethanopterin S-methyltransferase subunit D